MQNEIRDNKWLRTKFKILKNKYFADIDIVNNLIVKFGRPCRTRLGSIKKGKRIENFNSIITINGHFRDPQIPEEIIDAVLAHEFMHYAHGFASPHEQAYAHPHQGGVIDWDLKERGLGEILKFEKVWVKNNWVNYLRNYEQQNNKGLFGIRWR